MANINADMNIPQPSKVLMNRYRKWETDLASIRVATGANVCRLWDSVIRTMDICCEKYLFLFTDEMAAIHPRLLQAALAELAEPRHRMKTSCSKMGKAIDDDVEQFRTAIETQYVSLANVGWHCQSNTQHINTVSRPPGGLAYWSWGQLDAIWNFLLPSAMAQVLTRSFSWRVI